MAARFLAQHFLFKETEVLYFQFSNYEKKTDHTSNYGHQVSRIGTILPTWYSHGSGSMIFLHDTFEGNGREGPC